VSGDVEVNREVPPESYQRLQQPLNDDGGALCKLLHGLSTYKHHESSAFATEVFGISASNLSKRFKHGPGEINSFACRYRNDPFSQCDEEHMRKVFELC